MDFLYSDDSQDSYKSSSSSHSEHVLFRDNYILNEKTNKKKNILQLLYSREIGTTSKISNRKMIMQNIANKINPQIYKLNDIISPSAHDHVFLGFTKSGQFLLSYTYFTDLDVTNFNTSFKYRLHWWSLMPNQPARKVAEVMLFGDQAIYTALYIAVCQWPLDCSKVLVYGNCLSSTFGIANQAERCFITITTVPSLSKCKDCLNVAASYEEEDLAASWDSCVRFSCLKHGVTIHTNFDVVSPYPKFDPSISMKHDGSVVFNTGNFLHVLRANFENVDTNTKLADHNGDEKFCWEYSFTTSTLFDNKERDFFLDKDTESQSSEGTGIRQKDDYRTTSLIEEFCTQELKISCGISDMPTASKPDLLKTVDEEKKKARVSTRAILAEAEKAYEFTEEASEISCEKLSSFRRRRLADKKYEFCDETEDTENIVPFRFGRHSWSSIQRCPVESSESPSLSPRSPMLHSEVVLRPYNRNTSLSPRQQTPRSKQESYQNSIDDKSETTSIPLRNRKDLTVPIQAKCSVKFKRHFIEVEDELVSVLTDIEDEELGGNPITPYHFVLPLEVHGAAYTQLQMISKTKAEKLFLPGVEVQQMSFDVEQFCHEIAEWLCIESGKKYWFCSDYDIEIVDVCPFTGEVMVLAVMRIQATVISKSTTKGSSNQRKQYQGSCLFVWAADKGTYSIVQTEDLIEVKNTQEASMEDCLWNPAQNLARQLKPSWPSFPLVQSVISLTNKPELNGVSILQLSDPENLIHIVL